MVVCMSLKLQVITINSYDNVLMDPVDYELGISIEETTTI